MRYSRVLDAETFGRVVVMAPVVRRKPEVLAREIVRSLALQTRASVEDGTHEMLVGELAQSLGMSPQLVGLVLRELGLESLRFRDGWHFYWNAAQVAVLCEALGVEP